MDCNGMIVEVSQIVRKFICSPLSLLDVAFILRKFTESVIT